MTRRLPDRVQPGVRVLLVGINPGIRSAEIGHHFAGYSNRFWKLLDEAGLVPEPIGTEDDRRLPEWGYGITNLVSRPTPGIGDLLPSEYESGRKRLLAKIRRYRPRVVALIGVTLYRALFPRLCPHAEARAAARQARGRTRQAGRGRVGRDFSPAVARTFSPAGLLGLRPEKLAGADVFVLPNPSGRNAHYSYEQMLQAFRELKRHLDEI